MAISHITKKTKPKPSKALDFYWQFAAERQNIFFNRFSLTPQPWTLDPILKKYKFTNAYRASDRVSQFLINDVIYKNEVAPADLFLRIVLFKTFNKIETWQILENSIGEITTTRFSVDKYETVIRKIIQSGKSIYSGAYIMTSGKSIFGFEKKYQNHLRLIEMMVKNKLVHRIVDAKSLQNVYEILLEYPTIGTFLAYQYSIDLNYSPLMNFSENDFVMPGPGALDGISKCFVDLGQYTPSDIIAYMADNQEQEFKRLGIEFKSLWGRPLQLIDCQNLFCETDKYTRVAIPELKGNSSRSRIKQKYLANDSYIAFQYPPKWNINHLIPKNHERRDKEERFHQSLW